MVAVQVCEEYVTQAGEFQTHALHLLLSPLSTIYHIERLAEVQHHTRLVMTHRRLGRPTPEDIQNCHKFRTSESYFMALAKPPSLVSL